MQIVSLLNNEVLLVLESDDPNWKLPGGKIHENETIYEAVVREVKEKLGTDVDESQIVNYVAAPIPDSENIRHILLMKIAADSLAKTEEVDQTGYFSLDALPDTKFAGHIASAVKLVTT